MWANSANSPTVDNRERVIENTAYTQLSNQALGFKLYMVEWGSSLLWDWQKWGPAYCCLSGLPTSVAQAFHHIPEHLEADTSIIWQEKKGRQESSEECLGDCEQWSSAGRRRCWQQMSFTEAVWCLTACCAKTPTEAAPLLNLLRRFALDQ